MENKPQEEKKSPQTIKKEDQPKPLFEDLSGHKQDDASFNKLMKEQENRRNTKTGI